MDKKPRKRRKKADVVTHQDEQLEGAMMAALEKLKAYCPQGVIILNSSSDKWKVLTFGGGTKEDNFHAVLGAALAAGVTALDNGPENATEWDA